MVCKLTNEATLYTLAKSHQQATVSRDETIAAGNDLWTLIALASLSWPGRRSADESFNPKCKTGLWLKHFDALGFDPRIDHFGPPRSYS